VGLHAARHAARATPTDDIIRLEVQNRSLWDPMQVGEGLMRVDGAPPARRPASGARSTQLRGQHAALVDSDPLPAVRAYLLRRVDVAGTEAVRAEAAATCIVFGAKGATP
jgi:hypothetical protein